MKICNTRHTRGGGQFSRRSSYESVLQIRVKSKSVDKVTKEGVYYKKKVSCLHVSLQQLCINGVLKGAIT